MHESVFRAIYLNLERLDKIIGLCEQKNYGKFRLKIKYLKKNYFLLLLLKFCLECQKRQSLYNSIWPLKFVKTFENFQFQLRARFSVNSMEDFDAGISP